MVDKNNNKEDDVKKEKNKITDAYLLGILVLVIIGAVSIGVHEGTIKPSRLTGNVIRYQPEPKIEYYSLSNHCQYCDKQDTTIKDAGLESEFLYIKAEQKPDLVNEHNLTAVPAFRNPETGEKVQGYLNETKLEKLVDAWR